MVRKSNPKVVTHNLQDDGVFPNSRLPLLIYEGVFGSDATDYGAEFENVFRSNRWADSWRNGVYAYHHYHSTAHEVLGVYRGSAKILMGGDHGITLELTAGDAVVIPAGVAHKSLGATQDFAVVGAYPRGQKWDMNYGHPGERPQADTNIQKVALPDADPILGPSGPLLRAWQVS